MRHSTMLARTGVGFQAAWDRTPQHDQFPTSRYSLLRGNLYNVFLCSKHTESHMAQWIRRRACDHLASRSNPGIGFLFFTFLFFMELPIAVRELARVFDFNIYWPWIYSRRMHVSSKHVFSKYVFSKRMFSTFCLFRNVSSF